MTEIVRFGAFEFDLRRRELRKNGLRIRVPDQSLAVLAVLLEHRGETVTRECIQKQLWPDGTVVDFDQGINAAVKRLRDALGDLSETPRFIERVPRRGYRFIAPVEEIPRPEPAAPPGASPDSPVQPSRRSPLKRILLLGSATVAIAVAGWLWVRPRPAPARGATVVIADFENKTGDETFDGALRQALLAQVAQSPRLLIETEERVRGALGLMQREPGEPLTGRLAREVCQRVGATIVLAGSIRLLGSRYFVGLDAIGCEKGDLLASEYVEARAKEQVVAELSRAVSNLRRTLGESLPSMQKLSAPTEASTASFPALKAYSVALTEKAIGNDPVPFLRRAIELDRDFAAAYYTLAQVYLNRGQQMESEEAISRAYALRTRTSEKERLAIESFYHVVASGDLAQAAAAGRVAARLYPHDPAAQRLAFLPCAIGGDSDEASRIAQAGIELDPDNGVSYFNTTLLLLGSGKTRETAAVLDRARARGIDYDLFAFARYIAAALDDDSAGMEREARLAKGKPFEYGMLSLQVQTDGFLGQLGNARAIARYTASQNISSAEPIAATVALMEAVFGLDREARADAQTASRVARDRRSLSAAALALALTGSSGMAEAIRLDLLNRYPNDALLKSIWSPAIRGAIALKRGDAREALEAADAPAFVTAYAWPAYIRGMALLKLGHPAQAAAEFRGIIDRKPALFVGAFVYGAAFAVPAARLGLARALAMEGKADESRTAYEQLMSAWHGADLNLPLLIEARREHQALLKQRIAPSPRP